MARTTATNFSGGLQFPYATAATDVFHKEDIQTLAQAVDQHDHTAGKGHAINTVPANASITDAMLASDVARANLLTNGGFEIWQRGNGPFVSTYGADRWYGSPGAGATVSASRDTTNVDAASVASAAVAYTHAGTVSNFIQSVETAGLIGRPVTLSIRVRCSTANAVRARMWTGAAEVLGTTHTGGGGWETLTVTGTPTVTNGFYPGLSLMASCTAYADNAMLVVGSTPADYAPLHPADDLARCLRYYEAANVRDAKYGATSNQLEWWTSYKAVKAITPTITLSGNASTNLSAPNSAFTNTMGTDIYGVVTATGLALLNTNYVAEGNA